MNWNEIKAQWKDVKGQAKERWARLTDDDLTRIEGMRDRLAGAIQQRYGIEKSKAEEQVGEWEEQLLARVKQR